jgi:Cys-rich repeat protein
MKFWKIGWMLAVVGVVVAGCPTGDTDDTCTQDADCGASQQCEQATGKCVAKEDRNLLCTSSVDCLDSELCHPTTKVCVRTCRASADCPDTARACDGVSATDSTKICHCTTDTLCNQDRQRADLVCSSLDTVCTPKCVTDADCGEGRVCDTATGQCKAKGVVVDGGLSCTDASDCPASERCEPTTKLCVPKCTSDADCGEGHTCDTATGQCEEKVVDRSLSCTADSDCLEAELCHPTAKVCVQTCVSGADCPDSAKTCDLLSATDTRKVCKCSTDTLCNMDRGTPDLVCSNLDHVCAPKCATDADCGTGRLCETATGQCKSSGSTGAPCTGEGQSTCDYGTHFCSSNLCTPLPAPACVNYTNFPNKGNLGTTAAILYGARLVSVTTDTAYCGTTSSRRAKIALSAYSSTPFPSTRGSLSGFFMVNTTGTVVDASMLVASGDYSVSGVNRERAEIVVSLCFNPATTSASTGFYFTQGNFLCYQATF